MFYGDTIQDTRSLFFLSWEKHNQKKILSPLEQQLVHVILLHPEYHACLEKKDKTDEALNTIYFPELRGSNPFLHMGLHLAVRDQITTNIPTGIATIFQQLVTHYADAHIAEHWLMERLAESLWLAQRHHRAPDDATYLKTCQEALASLG